ncbi:hypothetical protein HPB50_011217 [Hyalomma asiaticum]|uniref:Uncharacterized protein n=1 Tax=Hyalomma asiaticum TaxID=266040 RepID=A0ACB7SX71_HYAAI|nr:hypothetical protein HPB50_011217 [Hyalomma asiaticum]
MIRRVLAIAFVTALSSTANINFLEPFSDEVIDYINQLNTTWKAGRNFGKDFTLERFQSLLGLLPATEDDLMPAMKHDISLELPESFDAREHWPHCPTIGLIRDQGECASCWAFGAAETISDRICIHSKGRVKVNISAVDIMSCCDSWRDGCKGGNPYRAWQYYHDHGIVTGGLYGTDDGCKPYPLRPCEHGVRGPLPPCSSEKTAPKCTHFCRKGYDRDYTDDKYYAKKVYLVHPDERHIRAEIFKHGPVEAGMDVYADFGNFKSGVYQRALLHNKKVGAHAVKILGWGTEQSVPYWLVANSWNPDWGYNGFFKILRGKNECGIEAQVIAGIPKL